MNTGTLLWSFIQQFAGKQPKARRTTNTGWLCAAAALMLVYLNPASAQGPQLEWARSAGGAGLDNSWGTLVDKAGNVYTMGHFAGTADFDPGPDSFKVTANGTATDAYILKLDATGKFLWARNFGNSSAESVYASAMDAEGNVYITGYFSGTIDIPEGTDTFRLKSNGLSDCFLLKLDPAGKFVWAKSFGGTSNDQALSVTIDAGNNVIVSGQFIGSVDFDPGADSFKLSAGNNAFNAFVLKLDAQGKFVWAKDVGQTSRTTMTVSGNSVTTDATGAIYMTGRFKDTVDFDPGPAATKIGANGGMDIYLMKLDAKGDFKWVRTFGSKRNITSVTLDESGLCVKVDKLGNVYSTGTFHDTVDFDPGSNTHELMAHTPGKNSDIYVLKLDSAGNFVWAKNIGGAFYSTFDNNYAFSINLDAADNAYITGYFGGWVDFNPGPNDFVLSSNGNAADIFILKLDPSGSFVWVKTMGGPDIDATRSAALDASGNIYMSGWFRGTSDFDPGPDSASFTSTPASATTYSLDMIVVKLRCGDTSSSAFTDSADCNGYTWNDTTYMETGAYIQTFTNYQGCDSAVTLNLSIIPRLDMDITIVTKVNVLSTAEHFASYQWMQDGQIIEGATDSSYTVQENGDYRVIVSNERGCFDTSDVYRVTSIDNSVDDIDRIAAQISVYPNPAKNMLYVRSAVALRLGLYSIEGKLLKQFEAPQYISLEEWTEGLYFIKFFDRKGNMLKTEKILKMQ